MSAPASETLDPVAERFYRRALSALEHRDSDLSRWKRIADMWCAAWLSNGRDGVPAAVM